MIKLCSGYGLQKMIYEECGVLIKISKMNEVREYILRIFTLDVKNNLNNLEYIKENYKFTGEEFTFTPDKFNKGLLKKINFMDSWINEKEEKLDNVIKSYIYQEIFNNIKDGLILKKIRKAHRQKFFKLKEFHFEEYDLSEIKDEIEKIKEELKIEIKNNEFMFEVSKYREERDYSDLEDILDYQIALNELKKDWKIEYRYSIDKEKWERYAIGKGNQEIKFEIEIDNNLRYFFKRCENKIKLYKVISEEDLLEKTIRLIKDKFKGEK